MKPVEMHVFLQVTVGISVTLASTVTTADSYWVEFHDLTFDMHG